MTDIFISHAVADKDLADKFVAFLKEAIGVPAKSIFCSMTTERSPAAPVSMQMPTRKIRNDGQAKPETGNPPDPSGSIQKPKSPDNLFDKHRVRARFILTMVANNLAKLPKLLVA